MLKIEADSALADSANATTAELVKRCIQVPRWDVKCRWMKSSWLRLRRWLYSPKSGDGFACGCPTKLVKKLPSQSVVIQPCCV